jgi:hypothetical protein
MEKQKGKLNNLKVKSSNTQKPKTKNLNQNFAHKPIRRAGDPLFS